MTLCKRFTTSWFSLWPGIAFGTVRILRLDEPRPPEEHGCHRRESLREWGLLNGRLQIVNR